MFQRKHGFASNKCLFLLIIFCLLCTMVKAVYFLDPDFGWHIKMGELISATGIPKTDPFSYTMPSFSFIDHEWFTNLFLYQLYSRSGIGLLAIVYLLFVAFTFFIIFGKKLKKELFFFKFAFFLLAFGSIFPFFGIRPQVISWLLLPLLLLILYRAKRDWIFFLLTPLLVIFWVNVHGSFALSIVVLAIYILFKTIRVRKIDYKELVVFVLCVAATFINPYGIGAWGEVWMQISDSALRWRIVEWKPAFFEPIFPYIFYLAFAYAVYIFRKNILLEKGAIFVFFLLQSVSSIRHIPLFIVAATPIYMELIEKLYDEIKKIKYGKERFQKAGLVLLVITFMLSATQTFLSFRSAFGIREGVYYPDLAVSYLKENLPENNIFSPYSWGGYLIWKLPEKKLFIDGRMPSWRWNDQPDSESSNAMEDYLNILSGKKDYKQQFEKYNIDTVFWFKKDTLNEKERTIDDYFAKPLNFFGIKRNDYNFFETLLNDGWMIVYEDDISIVYRAPDIIK